MEPKALLHNKFGWLIGLVIGELVLGGCQSGLPISSVHQIPTRYVAVDSPGWQPHNAETWYNSKPFSGWQFQLTPTGDTMFVGAFWSGKAEGKHRFWHLNGKLRQVRNFKNGWQEGQQYGWYESGKPAFVYHFKNDIYEGPLVEWFPDGKTARRMHYHDGQEAGLQTMWFSDGSLKANYEVRNGRNYGLTGVKNCVNTALTPEGTAFAAKPEDVVK
jgi:MORN repeat variant